PLRVRTPPRERRARSGGPLRVRTPPRKRRARSGGELTDGRRLQAQEPSRAREVLPNEWGQDPPRGTPRGRPRGRPQVRPRGRPRERAAGARTPEDVTDVAPEARHTEETGRNPRNDAVFLLAVDTFEAVDRPTGVSLEINTMRRTSSLEDDM